MSLEWQMMMVMAPIPTAMQPILTNMMSLLTLLYPIKDLGQPSMEGRTRLNTLSLSLPVTAADSPQCHSHANSFSMTLQKNIKTGTWRTLISLNFSHQKMCVW
jgi:hypothetical protein